MKIFPNIYISLSIFYAFHTLNRLVLVGFSVAGYIELHVSLRKKCPYSELFWFVFSRIWTEYAHTPYLSENGHFSRIISVFNYSPASVCLLKVNNRKTRTRYEICLKLTIKIPEQHHWCRSGVFIVNFGHTSHLVLVFLLLTLNM